MTEKQSNKPRAFINVTEKGKNFTMEDCEFRLGNSNRPIIEKKAENTRVIRLKVVEALAQLKERKWLWMIIIPLAIALLAKGIGIFIFGS